MKVTRRSFIRSTALAGAAIGSGIQFCNQYLNRELALHESSMVPPSFGVTPVVGDGKWIWRDPPKDGSKGYLEPREFEVTTGINFLGNGHATGLQATTVAPIQYPEQEIIDFKIETLGCEAQVMQLNQTAAQLLLAAPQIEAGQTVSAVARYRMRITKDYRGFSRESFPQDQTPPERKKRRKGDPTAPDLQFSKQYLANSPGISLRGKELKKLSKSIGTQGHPWDLAKKYYEWVWEHIKGVIGDYTSVEEAIINRQGDCEERATVFIALCRAAGIPARLVWVPSHNWAEIGLYDHDDIPHWIPIHTAAYSWFGWTGAHEVVLQKGDRVRISDRKRTVRLIDDWYRMRGKLPKMHFSSTVKPLPPEEGADPGPGLREKLENGRWKLGGEHPAQSSMRD